jgi:hypothetical protein
MALPLRILSCSALVLVLAACTPAAPIPAGKDALDVRADLPDGGISPLTEVAVEEGDAYKLQRAVALDTLFTKDTMQRVFANAPADEPMMSLRAGATLKYTKDQLYALLACKAAELQREKHFTSYHAVNYHYRPYAEYDLGVGVMLVRFSKEGSAAHQTHLKNWCDKAPKEAVPISAVTKVAAQSLDAPTAEEESVAEATPQPTTPEVAPEPEPEKVTDSWAERMRRRLGI